jgi:hypothetical protein
MTDRVDTVIGKAIPMNTVTERLGAGLKSGHEQLALL